MTIKPFTRPSCRPQPLHRPCRAMTLVEVSLAVALSAILLGMAVTLLAGLIRWDNRFRDHGLRAEQLTLLSETIRSDIRAATDVALPSKEMLIVTGMDSRSTRYELTPDGCQRMVKLSGDPNGRRDLFRIGSELYWKLDRAATGEPPTLVVRLERSDRDTHATQLLVCASRGADSLTTDAPQRAGQSPAEEPGKAR